MELIIENIPKYANHSTLKKIFEQGFKQKCKLKYIKNQTKAFISLKEKIDISNLKLYFRNKELHIRIGEKKEIKKIKQNNNTDIRDNVCQLYKLGYENQVSFKIKTITRFYRRNLKYEKKIQFCKSIVSFRNSFEFSFFDGFLGLKGFLKDDGSNVHSVENVPIIKNSIKMKIENINFLNQKITAEKKSLLKHLKIKDNDNEMIALISLKEYDKELIMVISEYPFENLYFTINGDFNGFNFSEIQKIRGNDYLIYKVFEYKFKVSFYSFFQSNIPVFESIILEISQQKKNNILLDLCCGTGSIGISLSKYFQYIFGVENNKECYESFEFNKKINLIKNYEYFIDNIEKSFSNSNESNILNIIKNKVGINQRYTAVLDPPRSGVSKKTIKKIRDSNIDELFYISCDYKQSIQNLKDLSKETSNNYKKSPFKIYNIKIFDMFPFTDKCELMIHFRREV